MVDNTVSNQHLKQTSTVYLWLIWWIFWSALMTAGVLLAQWQWDRAQQKEALITTWQSSRYQPPANMPPANYSRIRLSGFWQNDQSLWWDNRIHNGQVGVSLITPLTDETGRTWLINRGFLMTQGSRLQIPFPETTNRRVTIDGLWQDLSKVEPFLGINREGNRIADIDSIHWSTMTLAADGVIHQVAGPSLLTPHWQPNQNAAQRHYGYFIQWLLLTLVAAFVAFKYRPIIGQWSIKKTVSTPSLSPNYTRRRYLSGQGINRSER